MNDPLGVYHLKAQRELVRGSRGERRGEDIGYLIGELRLYEPIIGHTYPLWSPKTFSSDRSFLVVLRELEGGFSHLYQVRNTSGFPGDNLDAEHRIPRF